MREKISIIVPCYNEQEALPFFYKEISSVLQECEYDYELLFVNDGSRDETLNILRQLAHMLRVLCIRQNAYGKNLRESLYKA